MRSAPPAGPVPRQQASHLGPSSYSSTTGPFPVSSVASWPRGHSALLSPTPTLQALLSSAHLPLGHLLPAISGHHNILENPQAKHTSDASSLGPPILAALTVSSSRALLSRQSPRRRVWCPSDSCSLPQATSSSFLQDETPLTKPLGQVSWEAQSPCKVGGPVFFS